MALAATRCLDSLSSCSSVRDSSEGMAASAPTCICILTCFCLAIAGASLELDQGQQAAPEQLRALEAHPAAGDRGQRRAAARVTEAGQPGGARHRRQLENRGE